MINDTNRLKFLIDEILEISAMDYKGSKQDFQLLNPVNTINEIISDSIRQFKISAENLTITKEEKLNNNCVIDESALRIVVNNLLDNAVKYSHGIPKIRVSLTYTHKKFIMEFTDNGIGLPPDENKKIFKKFYRLYDKNIPTVKGTGLGLFWIKEIIKFHNGSIIAKSEGKDRGTSFCIELPLYKSSTFKSLNKLLKKSGYQKQK
jgi:signal transduction histidine kinase